MVLDTALHLPMDDWDTLHYATQRGDIEVVKSFLAKGSNINAFDDISFTPLHHAANEGHLDLIKVLLEAGADVNAHEEARIGNTPLGEIAGNCSFEIARLLIAAGADPTIRGWMQLSALDRAEARKKAEGRKVYELLVEAAKRFKRSH
jgi:ankyrin repeat protein